MKKLSRGYFALSGGRFPLNTPGRRKVAALAATRSYHKGNISRAQMQKVKRKARAASSRGKR